MNPNCYHIPVMLEECMEGLDIKPNGIYLDLTYGGGGHSKEIIKRLAPQGHLYGFDQDLDAKDGALTDERFTFIRSNFRYIKNWMQYYEVERVDGILADLGVSSHHLDDGGRGFSFRYDAPLDMRMNRAGKLSAKEIVAEYTEEQLERFENYMPTDRICNHYKRAHSLETFRRYIEEIPKKLDCDSYIYRIGKKYGLIEEFPRKIEFYFEQFEHENNNIRLD